MRTSTPRDEMQVAYALQNEAWRTARVLAPQSFTGKPSRRLKSADEFDANGYVRWDYPFSRRVRRRRAASAVRETQ